MPDTRFKGKSGLGYRGDSVLQADYQAGRIMQKLDDLGLIVRTALQWERGLADRADR